MLEYNCSFFWYLYLSDLSSLKKKENKWKHVEVKLRWKIEEIAEQPAR